jgi:hypothetical protein
MTHGKFESPLFVPYYTYLVACRPLTHTYTGVESMNREGKEEKEEEEEEEEEEESDADSVKTITNGIHYLTYTPPEPTSNHFYSCIACWSERSSTGDEWCDFCEMTSETIIRWLGSDKPMIIDQDGEQVVGNDTVQTPWICANCGEAKLILGGDTASEQVFEGYCTECEEVTDTVYADHAASFCCCDCRYERRHGTVSNQWKEWCTRCQKITDTVKLDTYQPSSHCCLVCRGDRDGEEGKREWCTECQRRTRTIEIDGETDQEEVDTIEEEDEEEDSSDEEGL